MTERTIQTHQISANEEGTSMLSDGLRLVSVVWVVAVLAAAFVAWLQGGLSLSFAYGLSLTLLPAILGLLLAPISDREWVRVSLLLSWTGLAIAATLAIAFMPMVFLFLCAPAAAALFKREMVIEAMVISALGAGLVYYLLRWGVSEPFLVGEDLSEWAKATGPAATIVFMIAAMFAVSERDNVSAAPVQSLTSFIGAAAKANVEGDILEASEGAHRLLGLPKIASLNLNDFLVILGEQKKMNVTDAVCVSILTGDPQILKTKLVSDNDRFLQIDIIPDGDTATLVMTDISEDGLKIQELLNKSNEAESEVEGKSLFFAGVSHELRTPLNAIIGFSDMMRSRLFGPLPGKYAEYADLIHDSGQHMLDLIGDVLDISKIDAGKYELSYDSFDATDVVRSSLKMIRPSADAAEVILDMQLEDNEPIMMVADRRAIRQVLLNLLSNAVKFSPKGGVVSTKIERSNNDVLLTVKDQGVGMSLEEVRLAGTPYVQAKSAKQSENRGTGLGLSLVKSLTDLHGGDVQIDSIPDKGTLVKIRLPREP